jgi:aminobenzoyl-glutamate utilization protein B
VQEASCRIYACDFDAYRRTQLNRSTAWWLVCLVFIGTGSMSGQQKISPEKEAAMKADLAGQIDGMKKQAQVMVDSVFSFGELGFQEFETSKYLSNMLEKEGFEVERGVAGIPTAFVATWGSGKPVIALGSDIDDNPAGLTKAWRRLS